jgi:NADPH-dependent ferric siderophore reductase
MGLYPRLMPQNPQMYRATVARTARLAPSFQRVTVVGPELGQFQWSGFDHWFRLFLPPEPDVPLVLPTVEGRAWWRSYRSIPGRHRPHCSNYTVADFRAVGDESELDIDVVLHWDAEGRLGGRVAAWAVAASAGSPLALLDQRIMFDPPPDVAGLRLAGDATGLPALRGIARSLDAGTRGNLVIEVPTPDDIVDLDAPPGLAVTWLNPPRDNDRPGAAALAHLEQLPAPDPADYAFIVGESALAAGGRRVLRRQGLAKSRITFSGFWKQSHHAAQPR